MPTSITRTVMALGLAALATPWTALPAAAAGDLMITPTRVVFEGRTRTAAISITNTGLTAATYRISWVRRRMTETGRFENIETPGPGERFADPMVRFSPRQVTLPPGKPQTVRLRFSKPAELENGEYRSHLLFRAVPMDGPVSADQLSEAPENPLQIALQPIYGVSIPVLVRQGETEAAVALEQLTVTGGDRLELRLARTGTRSVYGDLEATLVPPDGPPRPVGRLKGLAVYTPNASRLVELPLTGPLGPGTLRVTFRESIERPPLASGELALP